jgi:hypothetical protein
MTQHTKNTVIHYNFNKSLLLLLLLLLLLSYLCYFTILNKNQLINFILIVCKGEVYTSTYFSLYVIVKLPDDGYTNRPKQVTENRLLYRVHEVVQFGK